MGTNIFGQLRNLGRTTSRLLAVFRQGITRWLDEIRQDLDLGLGRLATCLVALIFSCMLVILLTMSLVALVLAPIFTLPQRAYRAVVKR